MLNNLLILIAAILLQGRGNTIPPPPPPPPPPVRVPDIVAPGDFVAPFGNDQVQQQQPQPGTATVEGIVTILGTGNPIPGAVVEMRRAACGLAVGAGGSFTTTSGPDGRFSFTKIPAGRWCIGAAKSGGTLAPVEYQQRGYKDRGLPIQIADNDEIRGIELRMPLTGSISGRVTDRDGEPMAHARVQAMEAFYQAGQKRLYTLNVVQTNDHGEFSLYWLPPGEYYVSAVPEDPLRQNVSFSVSPPGMGGHRSDAMPPVVTRKNRVDGTFTEEVYRPIYYGSGPDPRGSLKIDVRPGTNSIIALSFADAVSPAFHIRGRAVNGVTRQPAEGAQIRLFPRDWTATAVVPYAMTDKDGNFDIAGIAPGSYALYGAASMRDPNAPATLPQGLSPAIAQQLLAQGINFGPSIPLGNRLSVDVGNQNIENVPLTLLPGGMLNGEFVLEGNLATSLTQQQMSSFRVNLSRQPDLPGATLGGASVGNVPPTASNTAFQLQSIFPGDFFVLVSPLLNTFSRVAPIVPEPINDIFVKSIRYGSTDVLRDGLHLETHSPDQRLQVTLAIGGRLEGLVTNDRSEPMPNVKVALVPDFAYRNRDDLYKSATTDASGRFSIHGIAGGDYRVLSWENIADNAWQDAEILREFESRGKMVRIREGETAAVEVRAISGDPQ